MIITKLQEAPVELDVSSQSSCALRLARHSQMHGLDTSNVSSRVESSRAKWNLSLSHSEFLLSYPLGDELTPSITVILANANFDRSTVKHGI